MGISIRILSVFVVIIALAPTAFAQDDDADSFDGAVGFEAPFALEPATEFEFGFVVHNSSSSVNDDLNWICAVDMFLPSADYILPLDGVSDPDSLHGGGWAHDIDFDSNNRIVIMWMHAGLQASTASGCDIRESESIEFAFKAVTDENATDGFDWRLFAAGGASRMGTAYIGGGDDDVNDDADDDTASNDDADDDEWPSVDDDSDSGDESDDSSGASCGC
jgi:hypothetical protein